MRLTPTVDCGEQENLQIHHVVDDDGEIALRVAVTRPAPTGWPHENTIKCATCKAEARAEQVAHRALQCLPGFQLSVHPTLSLNRSCDD